MDKRTLFAMFLVIMLFMILNTYVFKPKPVPVVQEESATADSNLTSGQTSDSSAVAKTSVSAELDSLYLGSATSTSVLLSNTKVAIEFQTLGASISSIKMLDKRFSWAESSRQVDLVPEQSSLAQIKLLSKQATPDLSSKDWNYSQPDSSTVIFWLGEQANPLVTKTFTLDDHYGIMMDVTVSEGMAGIEYDFTAGIADSEKVKPASKSSDYKVLLLADNRLQKIRLDKIRKGNPSEILDKFTWAAMRTKYFTIAISDTTFSHKVTYFSSINPDTGNPALRLKTTFGDNEKVKSKRFLIYAGPADHDLMKKQYPGTHLEYIPDRGATWHRWLSNIVAWLLNFLHSFIPNYGVVIIIFSLILKILLHPLTHKSMDASIKMQRIQPKVQEIQKTYKSDPKTMQMELSKLYKEAGTSPLSGCLPLLLQMPIFFSLYAVLRYTLDMRNAYFMGWLKDLSEPDPLMILPIIMAGFMVLQSLMMRPGKEAIEQMDEKQKAMQQSTKMMTWLMPVMMFLIFKGLPSGLVLYYTVFNILSVAQQYYLQKHLKQQKEIA